MPSQLTDDRLMEFFKVLNEKKSISFVTDNEYKPILKSMIEYWCSSTGLTPQMKENQIFLPGSKFETFFLSSQGLDKTIIAFLTLEFTWYFIGWMKHFMGNIVHPTLIITPNLYRYHWLSSEMTKLKLLLEEFTEIFYTRYSITTNINQSTLTLNLKDRGTKEFLFTFKKMFVQHLHEKVDYPKFLIDVWNSSNLKIVISFLRFWLSRNFKNILLMSIDDLECSSRLEQRKEDLSNVYLTLEIHKTFADLVSQKVNHP